MLAFCTLLVVLTAVTAMPTNLTTSVVLTCTEPTDAQLRGMLQNGLTTTGEDYTAIYQLDINSTTIANNSRMDCPTSVGTKGELSNRSMCPWFYRTIRLNGWYPSQYVEAECRCIKCISGGDGVSCQRVYALVNFLRRTSCEPTGVWQYAPAYRRITVGCVCAGPRLY